MLTCAVDLGSREDTVSFQDRCWTIPHHPEGWAQLDRTLPADCEIVFEGRCAALEASLPDRALFSLDPSLSHRLRKALQESKDDVRDARTLAQLRQLRPEQFRPVVPLDPVLQRLRNSVRARRALVHHQTTLLEQLQAARTRPRGQKKSQWLEGFRDTPEGGFVQVLLTVRQQISTLDRAIAEQGAEVRTCVLLRSIPGMGSTLSAEITAELQGIAALGHSRQVRAYAGTTPVTISSGQYKVVRLRQRCNRRARNALYLFAFCSMRFHSWARSYYDAARQRGKTHSAALLALANRWLAVLCAMVKTDQSYDPSRKEDIITETS